MARRCLAPGLFLEPQPRPGQCHQIRPCIISRRHLSISIIRGLKCRTPSYWRAETVRYPWDFAGVDVLFNFLVGKSINRELKKSSSPSHVGSVLEGRHVGARIVLLPSIWLSERYS